MTQWQRRARFVIATAAVVFAVFVAFEFKRRPPVTPVTAPTRTDPGAVVEVTGGRVGRFKFSREDIRVDCEKQLVYADGTTKLLGVTITTEDRGGDRNFTVTGKEGVAGQNQSTLLLDGDVRLVSSDGMTVRTEHATYSDKENIVRASGPVSFSRGAMNGSGVGLNYDITNDVLTVLQQAVVHVPPDSKGEGAAEITAGTANFARRDHVMQFEGSVRLSRPEQIVESDMAVGHLSADEKQIESMELRGHSRITVAKPAVGGLQALNSRDMDLKYGADGRSLEHATLLGDGAIFLAGAAGGTGRQITAKSIDVTLDADGVTPVALVAREAVQLLLPAEPMVPMRTISSLSMRADGQAGRGLTQASFSGNVEYAERSSTVNRTATSGTLDVGLKPAMASIEDARFAHAVHFVDGMMTAVAADGRYDLDKGTLELTGSEPGAVRPHVVTEQLSVDAARVDLTLAGPKMKATGAVKSVLQPAKGKGSAGGTDTHLPSMFKGDKPVNVTAEALDYGGTGNKATYTGRVQLWQDETSIKGATIVLDDKTGDLSANGSVATVTVGDDVDGNNKPVRVRSVATANDFRYEDGMRRATYSGSAHMNSPEGETTAAKIELYFKPSGNDLDRVEAYDGVTLHDQDRTTTGSRLTYTTSDTRYVVTGVPVKVVDACGRETIGRTLTYLKSAQSVTMDGNEQTRTQTKGTGQCP